MATNEYANKEVERVVMLFGCFGYVRTIFLKYSQGSINVAVEESI